MGISLFLRGTLMASVVFFLNYSFSQALAAGEIFEVNIGTDERNGGVDNILNGEDTLLVTDEGFISISITNQAVATVLVSSGAGNVIKNAGRLEMTRLRGPRLKSVLIEISPDSTDTMVENSGSMKLSSNWLLSPPGSGDNVGVLSTGAMGDLTVINYENGKMIVDNQGDGIASGIEYSGLGNLKFTNAGTLYVEALDSFKSRAIVFTGKDLDVDISGSVLVGSNVFFGVSRFAVIHPGINNAETPSHRNIDISGSVVLRAGREGTIRGVLSDASNVTMNISGSFTGTSEGGFPNYGIFSKASTFALNIASSGKLSVGTGGRNSSIKGLHSIGDNLYVNSAGIITVSTTGSGDVYGIFSSGADARILNSGSIAASAASIVVAYIAGNFPQFFGIYSTGDGAAIINSGSIVASVEDGSRHGRISGIYSTGDGAAIINSGSIDASTTGIGAVYGVSFANGGSLVNSGTITSSRTVKQAPPGVSYAVGGSGAITISNSGSIIGSVKNNIAAINLVGGGGSLELRQGSFIVGKMLLVRDVTSISIDGDQPRSFHYVFGGDGVIEGGKPQVSGSSPAFYSADGKEVAILDTSNLIAGIDALEGMTENVSGLIRSRRFVQDDSKSHVWVSGAVSRRASGENVSFFTADDEIKDFSVGVDGVSFPRLSVGGLVGGSMVKSGGNDMPSSYQRESTGMFGAVYAIRHFDRIFAQSAVSGGFLKHNDKRFIQDNTVDNGIDMARSSYHSYWYSPEVTLGVGISASDWTYTPSVNLRYAHQWVDAYRETGSKSNVNYDSHSISLLSGRAELAVDRQFSSTHLTLRAGLQSFGLIGGSNDVSFSMLDNPAQTFVMQSGNKKGVYGGVDMAIQLSQNASLTLGGEAIFSKDKKMDTHLTAGLDIAF